MSALKICLAASLFLLFSSPALCAEDYEKLVAGEWRCTIKDNTGEGGVVFDDGKCTIHFPDGPSFSFAYSCQSSHGPTVRLLGTAPNGNTQIMAVSFRDDDNIILEFASWPDAPALNCSRIRH